MKRVSLIAGVLVLGFGLMGCATIQVQKPHYPLLIKTSNVFIGEITVFTEMETDQKRIKDIGRPVPVDDIYYQGLAQEFEKALVKNLKKRGLEVVDQPNQDSLIIRVKIGYKALPSGKVARLFAHGRVGVQVELWPSGQEEKFSDFEATLPTAYIGAGPQHGLRALAAFSARTIINKIK